MCTVTIRLRTDDVLVTMNRDEQKSRPTEIPAFYWKDKKITAPQDSLRGGTWMAVNDRGHVACLLNGYKSHGSNDMSFSKSRGDIIPGLLGTENPRAAAENLSAEKYDSFRLVLIQDQQVSIHEWDFLNYHSNALPIQEWYFFTSSTYRQPEVQEYRQEKFNQWIEKKYVFDGDIPTIHTHYDDERSAFSSMMYRDDACTKSITQYNASNDSHVLNYWPVMDYKPQINQTVKIPVLV